MSHRLSQGGRQIDRSQPQNFTFNGRQLRGFKGDTLASALIGQDQMLVGRSFKYHRPRGIVTSGPEEMTISLSGSFHFVSGVTASHSSLRPNPRPPTNTSFICSVTGLAAISLLERLTCRVWPV